MPDSLFHGLLKGLNGQVSGLVIESVNFGNIGCEHLLPTFVELRQLFEQRNGCWSNKRIDQFMVLLVLRLCLPLATHVQKSRARGMAMAAGHRQSAGHIADLLQPNLRFVATLT